MPTEAETNAMKKLIHEGMDHGACGWSAQRFGENSVQADFDGTPMVTDLMHDETALELAKVLGERNEGFIQMSYIPNSSRYEGDAQDHTEKHFEELALAAGRPILYNAIAINDAFPERFRRQMHWIESCAKRGIRVYGQGATLDLGFLFTFKDWNLWDDMPEWREVTVGSLEDRLLKLSDPERRPGLRKVDQMTGAISNDVRAITIVECKRSDLKKYENRTVGEVANEENKHPVDVMLDIATADGLNTEFYTPPLNVRNDFMKELVTSEGMTIFGVSDGGAHTKFFSGGRYSTEALIRMGRDSDMLSLEELHFRLSAHPAMAAGFKNRGTLVEGAAADVIVYDLNKLAIKPLEIVHDFPGGEWRRVQRAEGYSATLVNGEVTFDGTKCTGNTPGRLLRRGG
jgi:N-acyl-D-amino-acid deacylase